MVKIIKLLFFAICIFSCDGDYFNYRPLNLVEGKKFQILSFIVEDNISKEIEDIAKDKNSKMSFTNCDSKKDIPCKGELVIGNEITPFTFTLDYEGGIFTHVYDLNYKNYPEDYPPIWLVGTLLVERKKKGLIELKGRIGFTKNYPRVLGTHNSVITLKQL